MSSIFGIFRFDQGQVDSSWGTRMKDALNYWQADREGISLSGNVLLGNLLLWNTPESLQEVQPYETESVSVTADARIDNRDELLKWLGGYPDVHVGAPDSTLIARAYQHFGTRCTEYLLGDFAFAIWDKKAQSLFLATDHFGIKPLFYYCRDGIFAFSSEKKGLLALPFVDPSVNEDYVFALLADVNPLPGEHFHRHIDSLPAAHQLSVTHAGLGQARQYWTLERQPLLELPNEAAYVEAFLAEFDRSVKARMRTVYPIACELSGGLDSSGVTACAIKQQPLPGSLFTFSNVVKKDDSGMKPVPDEEALIDNFLQFHRFEQAVKVDGVNLPYLQAYHDLDLFVHDGIEIYSGFWQEPLRDAMEERGCRVILSGFGGDEVVTNRGLNHYYEYLEEGRWEDFAAAARAQGKRMLPYTMWARRQLPQRLQHFLNRDARKGYVPKGLLQYPEWEAKNLRARSKPEKIPSRSQKSLFQRNISMITGSGRFLTEGLYAKKHRLEPRYPMVDIRLLNFFMSLPADMLGSLQMDRYLYRLAMKGMMPDETRYRSDKTMAAGAFWFIEDRNLSIPLREWLTTVRHGDFPGMLKRVAFDRMLERLDPGLPENQGKYGFEPARSFKAEMVVRYYELKEKGIDPLTFFRGTKQD